MISDYLKKNFQVDNLIYKKDAALEMIVIGLRCHEVK